MNIVYSVINYLEEFNEVSVALRLVVATIMGSFIGIERANTKHAAGLRTFALVCLGSALAQIVDIRCVMQYGTGDPMRLAQGVINGIGFLGVGTIVVTGKSHIKGLTTAATLWTTAVLGIAIGSGYVFASVVTFVLIMVTIKVMANISRRQEKFNRELGVRIEIKRNDGIKPVMDFVKAQGYKVFSMEKKYYDDYINLHLELDLGSKKNHEIVLADISKIDSVDYIEEIL